MARPLSSYDLSKNTTSFVALKRGTTTTEVLSEDIYRFDTEKNCKKYFGKKLKKLIFLYQSSSWPSTYHCKTVRHLKVYGFWWRNIPLRSVKTITLYSRLPYFGERPNTKPSSSSLISRISNYKSLRKLEIYSGKRLSSLDKLRTLKNLQEISLFVSYSNHIVENSHTLLKLNSLKKFSLSFRCMVFNDDLNTKIAYFCTEILGLKTLRSVNLYLINISFDDRPALVEGLLDCLQRSKCHDFYVQLVLPSEINLQKVQMTLDYVDLVNFTTALVGTMTIGVNNSNSIEELRKPLSQARKKIKFATPIKSQELQKIPASQPFNLLESVNNLTRKVTGYEFLFFDYVNAKNLRSLTMYFSEISHDKLEEITQVYIHILKNSPYLKELSLDLLSFFLTSSICLKLYKAIMEEITNLKGLTSLSINQIPLSEGLFVMLQKPLSLLKNLEQLNLRFQKQSDYNQEYDLGFSFGSLTRLTELTVTLPVLSKISQVNFLQDLSQLLQLKILNILGISDVMVFISKRILQETLPGLKKLEVVELRSNCCMGPKTGFINEEQIILIKELFAKITRSERFSIIDLSSKSIQFTRHYY